MLTGAWTTQAIAVAAELRLADHLAAGVGSTEHLATLTETDHDSLYRLLRFLASIGILSISDDTVSLTPLGDLLRTDAPHSMQPLALMYGGPFYSSFGSLLHTVRTGQESFQHVFGQHHFDYFAAHPPLAALFDRAMASSGSVFAAIPGLLDTSRARTIVDIAGGNGALLSHILAAHPHLHGILLERPHAIEAAHTVLAPYLDRCSLVVGDFTTGLPPAADLYILSRILHDWDDHQSAAILKLCAESMPPHATLLIIERLLPSDGAPSLAVPWDLHMMTNVGGRERTLTHYRALLADANLTLTTHHLLPLDFSLLLAHPSPTPGVSPVLTV